MGYRAGIGESIARFLLAKGPNDIKSEVCSTRPHYFCDACGVIKNVARRNGQPYKWFLDGRLPPGWTDGEYASGRLVLCTKCSKEYYTG